MRTDEPSYIVSIDGLTGKVKWRQERATDAQRESPDAYTTPVLLRFDGTYTLASPAVSGSHLFIRTSTHLYCIEGNGN